MIDVRIEFLDWLKEAQKAYRDDGISMAVLKATRSAYNGFWYSLTSRYPIGTNVFSKEWDLLIILDGCRVDALRTVAPEYGFLGEVGSILSVGSASHEWTVKTFRTKHLAEIEKTGFISSNPFFDRVFERRETPPFSYSVPISIPKWDLVSKEDFCYTEWVNTHIDPYWEAVGLDFNIKSAEYVTDRTIIAGRSKDCERIIAHYFQPHRPFVYRAVKSGTLTEKDDRPYELARKGELSKEELWGRYLDNLRYVLNSVEKLLDNLDAERVVISADHGNLVGELGIYGHPGGFPHPSLKRVPWAVTTASDTRTHHPDPDIVYDEDHDSFDNLRALGYV